MSNNARGYLARHLTRFEVYNKQSLTPFDFARVFALFLDARENGTRMVAKIHSQLHEFFRARDFLHALDGADANVQRVKRRDSHARFDGCGSEFSLSSPRMVGRGAAR